ncbi:YczE/YyaS/YitT family protein [Ureibacillus manganicus]|uniref:Membrane protein n=1 Tax=Ureibacillus manganicus DSM 26584 TaxID=1384049 RepID=A0A0A3IZK8_9BACL|nr:membrane protein [Ureibacillus manganicus]KGR80242.1 membrane protein [Ureibacillus manganicus DSM 26584]
MRKVYSWRWAFFFVGIVILSLGVSMVIKGAELGTSAWDVLHIALFENFGLTIGTWNIITGLLVIGFTSIMKRQFPKIGTWINMVVCGFFIDLFYWILPASTSLTTSIIYYLLGLLVLGFGCAMYIAPNLGAGPRDSLMMWIVERFGGSIRVARMSVELAVALIGWILGGPLGVGTVIIAVFSGYVIQFSLPYCRKMLLKAIGDVEEMKPFF